MNLSASVVGFFSEPGHVALLILVPAQATLLALFGRRRVVRFFGSFILPLAYSIQEAFSGIQAVLDMAHVFFWVFSLVLATLQTVVVSTRSTRVKQRLEFATTFVNVLTFLFLYFYFDLKGSYMAQVAAGTIPLASVPERLEIYHLGTGLGGFVADPTHIYVIVGGLILGMTLALGRTRIIGLKDRINELFGRYVDRDIRDRILGANAPIAERRSVAILFCDIRGFTSLTEQNDAAAIASMLNRYFGEWHRTAARHGGIVDKYIGDAVMILFGLNDVSGDAGARKAATGAVACGAEMLERFPSLQSELGTEGFPVPTDIGIGIDFGESIVGDIGSPERMNFTAIGDNVNVAARLEKLTKNRPSHIIVSHSVYRLLEAPLRGRFSYLGGLPIRGKVSRLRAFAFDR